MLGSRLSYALLHYKHSLKLGPGGQEGLRKPRQAARSHSYIAQSDMSPRLTAPLSGPVGAP